jgi:hypothetical protein
MRILELDPLLLIAAGVLLLPLASAQSVPSPGDSASAAGLAAPGAQPVKPAVYVLPGAKARVHNYLFDTFGPYPIVGAAVAAGINQAYKTPPEWGQGAAGYGRRFGSDFGIAAVTTSTRYALATAFHEDTLYYRCECKGVLPRLRHAVIATFTSRSGEDGHRVFSFPALVAPYAGTMTAVYAWYPDRFDARDGFRMGNYSLLAYMGGNVALEFLYRGPRSWLSRAHLNNRHGAPD